MKELFEEKATRIKAMVFDVDGVLTDGALYYTGEGEAMKRFFVLDGVAMKMLKSVGIIVAVMSAKESEAIKRRCRELGIEHVYMGGEEKYKEYLKFLRDTGLSPEDVCYMGDDLPDVPIMRECALSIAPANAPVYVKDVADYVTKQKGGEGAAREAVERLLKAKGRWQEALSIFLKEG
jgi:3-deoxy-D-manno-octulosonate 8-phosphate phosphatase (KDO 8-P phosphatase)